MPFDRALLEDVARRGRVALDEYNQQRQLQTSSAGRALDARQTTYNAMQGQAPERVSTGRGPAYDALTYQLYSRVPHGGERGIAYGRTDEGDYAGYKNSSDLWNAVEGLAMQNRSDSVEEAEILREMANQSMTDLTGQYDTNWKAAEDELEAGKRSEAARQAALEAWWKVQDTLRGIGRAAEGPAHVAGPGTPRAEDADARMERARVEAGSLYGDQAGSRGSRGFIAGDQLGVTARNEADLAREAERDRIRQEEDTALRVRAQDQQRYAGQLNEWLAQAVDPAQQVISYADDVQAIPLSRWAEGAGAELGVDPLIVAGRFGQAEDYRDYGQQRNLAAIDEYGLPYSEVTQLQGAADRDAEAALADQEDAGQQALTDELAALTGMDASQLAATTDMDERQLAMVVADPDYQTADAELSRLVEEGDPEEVAGLLRSVGSQRPDIYRVLLAAWDDYLPDDYSYYEG